MSRRYIHFTSQKDAKAIKESQELWKSSYGPNAVFAVAVGASHVPGVQQSSLGRTKVRGAAVIFETDYLPDIAHPEEVMWHMDKLPIYNVQIVSPSTAIQMLDKSIPVDEDYDMLKIPLHPAFSIWGDWTRMPEDFQPWMPGKDNETYKAARELWNEDQDVDLMRSIWNDNELSEELSSELLAFLTEQESKLPVDKGEEWDIKTSSPEAIEVEDDVFDMIDKTYQSLGGNAKISSPKQVRTVYPHEILSDVDNDPEPDSVVMYSYRGDGKKFTVLASDGSAEGKQAALLSLAKRLESGGWIEVSGPLAHVLINKMGMKPIEDKELVGNLLGPSRPFKWVGKSNNAKFHGTSGWYLRKIGGQEHLKTIVGNP